MKKILIFIAAIISITGISNADFGSINSLDLYSNIDNGITQLQESMEVFELEGGEKKDGILSEINKYAVENQISACLDESKNLSPKELKEINNKGDVEKFVSFLNDKCLLNYAKNSYFSKYGKNSSEKVKNSKGLTSKGEKEYGKELLILYMGLLKTYEEDNATLAEVKTDQIYKISQIGIYADGNLNNSGFDLISDIEDIDKIIFANVIDYEGEDKDSINDVLNNFLKPLNDKVTKLASPRPFINKEKNIVQPIQYSPVISNENNKNTISTSNEYACINDLNNSGLSNNTLDGLLNNINNDINGNNTKKELTNKSGLLEKTGNQNNNSNNENNGNYKKVTDNSEWPCETFFCIMIDFSTYEHNLFGGGEDITIEYLLNRSNKHLSKYAATSLVPAKMGTNEFELGLKDLNLPDIFHLSFQVSTKPIPILNIEKEGKEDETEFSSKNMLESYYKINGLDYHRRNDLDALAKLEANKQNINNAAGLTIEELLKKQKENDSIVEERQKKANTLRKAIDERVSYGMMSTFEEQFTELDKFTLGINDYIDNLDGLIDQLRKIPIEY